jgi:hypothetical protein
MSHLVGNALVVVSALISLTFIIVYHLRAYWWRTSDGRHVFTFMAVIAAVLTSAAMRVLLGDPEWYTWLRVVVFSGVPVVLAWRLAILLSTQTRRRIRFGRVRREGNDSERVPE